MLKRGLLLGSRTPQNNHPNTNSPHRIEICLVSSFSSFLVQFLEKEEDLFKIRRTIFRIADDPHFVDDDGPSAEDRISFDFG